jgi:hypothetical protein
MREDETVKSFLPLQRPPKPVLNSRLAFIGTAFSAAGICCDGSHSFAKAGTFLPSDLNPRLAADMTLAGA